VIGLLLAAPYGLTAMAATLAGMSVVFAAVRLTVANRLLGVRVRTSLRAMTPGTVAAVGAAAGALPVVALREPELETLLLAVAAGVVGAAALLFLLCRPVLRELVALAASMRRSKAGT
jgi:lipopolysaccharide exporter